MRVCYLADAQSAHIIGWAQALAHLGHEVHIISFRPNDIPGVHVHTVESNLRSKLKYLVNVSTVRNVIHSVQPDILHAVYLTSYGLLGALSGFHPFIAGAWGSDVLVAGQALPMSYVIRWVLGRADAITATGPYLQFETKRLAPGAKIVLNIPIGVNTKSFLPVVKPPQPKVTLAMAKGLEPVYGFDVALEAMAQVVRQLPDIQLLLIGDGSLRRRLKADVERLGLREHVRFVGHVPHDQMPAVLGIADILLMPSRSESWGIVALEAQAMGIPVVASDVGGIPHVVKDGETGLLIPPNRPDLLAKAVLKLVGDPHQRDLMGRNGRSFVEANHNWQDGVQQLLSAYETHGYLHQGQPHSTYRKGHAKPTSGGEKR